MSGRIFPSIFFDREAKPCHKAKIKRTVCWILSKSESVSTVTAISSTGATTISTFKPYKKLVSKFNYLFITLSSSTWCLEVKTSLPIDPIPLPQGLTYMYRLVFEYIFIVIVETWWYCLTMVLVTQIWPNLNIMNDKRIVFRLAH